jgi:hypothetical protein
MPAIASIEELKAADDALKSLKEKNPSEYAAFAAILKKHRKVGYKNICKMLLGEATPEKLKGLGE